METEQSKKISNETLLEDIKNTELELKAYQNLVNGYCILMELPENTSDYNIRMQYFRYIEAEKQCAEFLNALHKLKSHRGI